MMFEEENLSINEQETVPLPEPELPPATWRDAAAPVLAIALSALFFEVFGFVTLIEDGLPGLGVPVFVAAHFAIVFLMLGKRVRLTPSGLFCLVASLILAVCCALYVLEPFIVYNCFIILVLAAMATFSLSGQARYLCSQSAALPETFTLTLRALFTRVSRPFRMAGQVSRKGKGELGRALQAVLVALPVLAVVLWLLSSADQVFGSLLTIHADFHWGEHIFTTVRTLFTALFITSALYFIREDLPQAPAAEIQEKELHALPFLLVTILLDGVYLLFCAIQVKYLFGGAAAAAMAGGWAEYARSGFFQLVAVAVINLGLCLMGTDGKRFAGSGGKVLRWAFGLLLALTAVILVSAFWRMRLYILAYGMSILRLETLWGMAVIAVGILTAAWKLYRPNFGFFRIAGGFAVALWCVMCLANPAGMIASYNIDHYVSGDLPELDLYYISYDLGADALPALPSLQQLGEEGQEKFDLLTRRIKSDHELPSGAWPQWHLSAWRASK